MGCLRLWWKAVLACAFAVTGVLSLTGQIVALFDGNADLTGLRAHGTSATAHAQLMTHCSMGTRGGTSCDTAAVWLAFTARNQQMLVYEKPVDGTLYVPHGHTDALAGVVTTVVYLPANPDDAQPEGALDQSILDLASQNLGSLSIAVLMITVGAGVALSTWPDHAEREGVTAASATRRAARQREFDADDAPSTGRSAD